MDLFSKLINDVEDVCEGHIEKGQIISNLKNDAVKNAIIDVISGQKSLEELKLQKEESKKCVETDGNGNF